VLFSYLFATGYITGDVGLGFTTPNHETAFQLEGAMTDYFLSAYKIKTNLYKDAAAAFTNAAETLPTCSSN
jgi:hypothetical protein